MDSNVEIYKDSHSFKKSMSRRVDIDMSIGIGGIASFSSSSTYKKIQKIMHYRNSSKYIEELVSHTSGYKVNVMPEWYLQLGRIAQLYVDKLLPKQLNRITIRMYMKFVQTFGTHYFIHGNFGGILRLLLTTNSSYFRNTTETTVIQETKRVFKLLFVTYSQTSTKSHTWSKVESKFMRESRYFVR